MNQPRRFAVSAVIRSSAAALAFASQVLLVRLLSADAYGSYVVFVTSCALLALVASGGLDVIITRRVSTGYDRRDQKRIVQDICRAALLALALGVLTCAVLAAVRASPISSRWHLLAGIDMSALLLGVSTLALATLGTAAVRGLHRFVVADMIDFLARPLAVLAGVAALAVSAPPATALAPAAFIGANALTIVLCALAVRHALRRAAFVPASAQGTATEACEEPLRPSSTLVAYGLMSYAMFQLDTLLVGIYRGALEVGAYNMACNFVRLVIFVPLIIVAQMQPRAAVLFSRGEHAPLIALVRSRVGISLLAAGSAGALLAVSGPMLLRMVDPQFSSATAALMLLCMAHLCNSALLVLSGALLMGGLHSLVLRSQICGLAVCIPLYFVLIPDHGGTGAAAAVLAGLAVNLAALASAWRSLPWGAPR